MSEAGNITIVLSCDKATYTQGMNEAQRQLDKFKGKSASAARGLVQDSKSARNAMQLLSGQTFAMSMMAGDLIGKSRTLSKALEMAFPVIGAVAFATVIGKVAVAVDQFITQANQLKQATRTAFQGLDASADSASAELAITNDKLRQQIDLLEGKNPNNLKLALDEDREAADKLATSLIAANKQMMSLLKTNQTGSLDQVLTNQKNTYRVSGSVNSYDAQIQNLATDYRSAVASGNKGKAKRLYAQLLAKQKSAVAWANTTLNGDGKTGILAALFDGNTKYNSLNYLQRFSKETLGFTPREDNNIQIVKGAQAKWQSEIATEGQTTEHNKLQAKLTALKNKKAHEAFLKKHHQEELRQYREQQQKLIRTWHTQLDAQKAFHAMSLGDEANFWIARAQTVKYGSISYKAALDSADKLIGQQRKQYAGALDVWHALATPNDQHYTGSDWAKHLGTWNYASSPSYDLSRTSRTKSFLTEQGQAAAEYVKGLRKSIQLRQQHGFAMRSEAIHAGVASGRISVLSGAQQTAALHANEYAAALANLHRQLAAISNDPALTKLERAAMSQVVKDNILSLQSQRILQQWNDQAAIYNNTVGGSLHNSLQQFATRSTNTAAQASGLLMGGIHSVNGALATSMMAHTYTGREYRRNIANSLSGAARGIGSHLLNASFQHVEGGILGKFLGGKHKPDGSAGNPLYVRMAGAAHSAVSSIGGILHHAGGFLGRFGHLFQGSFANGGDVLGNRPAIVGERGPELFVPRSAGTIIPNHSLSYSSGGVQIHNHIDARGAHDPAAVEASVHRAMHQLAGPMAAIALKSSHEHRLRTPGMRG